MKKVVVTSSFLLVAALSIFFTSCATIVTGTKQSVSIMSNVDSADVYLDGIKIGQTPFVGEVKKNGKTITVEKKGYKRYSIALSTTLEGLFWGNIITGGTVGSITDFASGAAYKYAPASFQIELIADKAVLENFKMNYELRKFAMLNMSNISIDLSNNSGTYLQSLLYLAHMEMNDNTIKIVRDKLIKSNGSQVVFGNSIVELLSI
ncbi:MAG: PEGA domain-containing protein [Ignavibacteriales bacterium]|nr:PEGA domain-containing protein [Ignavibacteriales bacterium]